MAPLTTQKPGMAGQELPGRENASFRTMVRLYEEKRHKKALKMAEGILKKYPQHGETTSMKGLISWYIPERRAEALELARKGLRLNVTNQTCWHILGLIHRNQRDYNEAMRCFKQAVKIEPDNLVLARDLTNLQIHEGNVNGFLEMRKSLFFSRAGVKAHWTTYAFAQHLCGNYKLAHRLLRTTIDHFQRLSGLEKLSKDEMWENGELLLYEAMVLEEGGLYDDAIKSLEGCPRVPDNVGRLEALGRLYVYVNRWDDAHSIYVQLFKHQRANKTYLLCAMATHPQFRQKVIFPVAPACTRQASSTVLANGYHSNKQLEMDLNLNAPAPEKFLMLSLYALRSTTLHCSVSQGWLTQPRHIVFPFAPKTRDFNNRHSEDVLYYLIRQLTPQEEEQLSEWLLEDIFVADVKNVNDSALRLLLDFVNEEERFIYYLDKLIRRKLTKGAPFVMNMIKLLCGIPHKAAMIQRLLSSYLTSITERQSPLLGQHPKSPSELKSTKLESCQSCIDEELVSISEAVASASYVIVLSAIASLYDFTGQQETALEYIEMAITNTPTLVELYQVKARILKHLGDYRGAANAICEGREMDLADRFLNTKGVKYLLAIDDTERAAQMALYFSQEDNLAEMQSILFELRMGESFKRQNKLGLALKQYYLVLSQFEDMRHDLFDFHWYCQRRGGFRSYLRTLRMRSRIYAQQYYRRAIRNIIFILLDQFDNPVSTQTPTTQASELETTSKATKKKKKKTDSPNPTTQSPNTWTNNLQNSSCRKPIDEDAHGLKLLRVGDDALNEASNLIDGLRNAAQNWPQTHQMAYEIYTREGQLLLAVQCLYRLWCLSGKSLLEPILSPYLSHLLLKVMLTQPPSESNLGAPSEDNDTLEVCQNVLVEIFECSFPSPPSCLTETIMSADYKQSYDLYVDWVFEQSATTPEELIAMVQCAKIHENGLSSHCGQILGTLQSLHSSRSFGIKMMSLLLEAVKSSTIYTEVLEFFKKSFPRANYI